MSELDQVLDSIMAHDMVEFEKQKRLTMAKTTRPFLGRRFILPRLPSHDPPVYTTTINISGGHSLTMSIMLGDHHVHWDVHVLDDGDRHLSIGGGVDDENEAVRCVELAVRDIEHFFATKAGLSRQEFVRHLEAEGIDVEEARRVARAFKERFPELSFLEDTEP